MSVEALTWALNLAPVPLDPAGARRSAQPNSACAFVLVGLANHAGPDGKDAFPGVDTLMRYTRLSERTVRTALDRLEEGGTIRPSDPDVVAAKIKRADRRPNGYDLCMDLVREDLTDDEMRAIAKANPFLRPLIDQLLRERGATAAPRPPDDGVSEDERGAMGSERGAMGAERGATVAPEPSLTTQEPSEGQNHEPADAASPDADVIEIDKKVKREPEVQAVYDTAREVVTAYMDWWKSDRGIPAAMPLPDGTREFMKLVGARPKAANCQYVTAALVKGYTRNQCATALANWASGKHNGGRKPDGLVPSTGAWTSALAVVVSGREPEAADGRTARTRPNENFRGDDIGGWGKGALGSGN